MLTKAAAGIGTTPATAAGIADLAWTVKEILERVSSNICSVAPDPGAETPFE